MSSINENVYPVLLTRND